MKEHPILFSDRLVRAILEGRKTQTRRILGPTNTDGWRRGWEYDFANAYVDGAGNGAPYLHVPRKGHDTVHRLFPRYEAGDRLWVRETWMANESEEGLDGIAYRADDAFRGIENTQAAADAWLKEYREACRWRPSIHMPRWASRITLDVVSVRVERLQEISEADAIAEGIQAVPFRPDDGFPICDGYMAGEDDGKTVLTPTAREAFSTLWDSINGDRDGASWAANSWVWATTFDGRSAA